MSWWIVDGGGYVNWSPVRRGVGAVVLNKSAMFHTPKALYNGDEAVALFDKFLPEVREQMADPDFAARLRTAFAEPPKAASNVNNDLCAKLDAVRDKIHRVYRREWNRNACKDELYALFNYCTCLCAKS